MTTHRSTVLSAVLSVLLGALALGFVATAPPQRLAIGVTLVGVFVLGLGLESRYRGYSLVGGLVALSGTATVGGALVLAFTRTASLSHALELVPGLLGLFVLGAALGHAWTDGERALVSLGTALLLVSIVTSVAVYETDTLGVLLGGVTTVLAWDVAEQAVNLGEQSGREATTRLVEVVHAGSTAAVGLVAIGAVLLIAEIDVNGVPLTVLAGLLGAGFTLALALYN